MISFITASQAQKQLAINVRLRRLELDLTQQGLAQRSGVPLPTLRKFEQKGVISLEGFLKLQMVLGGLEKLIKSTEPEPLQFASIDEVLALDQTHSHQKKRGRRK